MKNYFLLLSLFVFFSNSILSAHGNETGSKEIKIGISLEQLSQTGLHAAYYIPLKKITKTNRKEKTKERSFFVQPQLLWYIHPGNHHSFNLTNDFGIRLNKKNKEWYHQFALRFGLSNQINLGNTYEYNENGEVEVVTAAQRFYLLSGLTYEVGRKLNKSSALYISPSFNVKFPYNNFINSQFIIDVGYRILLNKSHE